MPCNIDAKGKVIRLIAGLLTLIAGAVLAFIWRPNELQWWIGLLFIASGVFAIIEGWAGWCVVRAMGFKTRI